MLIKFVCWLLKHKKLSAENKARLMTQLISSVGALPITDVIEFDAGGNIYVNKRRLENEQALLFRETIGTLENSTARRIINEQLRFMAVKIGVHEGMTTEQVLFSKAMLYCLQEEDKLIKQLSLTS